MELARFLGDLFREDPGWWGLRGDPYLWRDLRERFAAVEMPADIPTLHHLLETAFWEATGQSLAFCGDVYVGKYAHGGLSSGGISGEFWRDRGFAEIVERFKALGQ